MHGFGIAMSHLQLSKYSLKKLKQLCLSLGKLHQDSYSSELLSDVENKYWLHSHKSNNAYLKENIKLFSGKKKLCYLCFEISPVNFLVLNQKLRI